MNELDLGEHYTTRMYIANAIPCIACANIFIDNVVSEFTCQQSPDEVDRAVAMADTHSSNMAKVAPQR